MLLTPSSRWIHALAACALLAACGGEEEDPSLASATAYARGDGTPVRVLYTKAVLDCSSGKCGGAGVYGLAYGYRELKNIAPKKQVMVHYTTDGSTWKDQAASYVAPSLPGYELWYFKLPGASFYGGGALNVRFAVRYTVAGQTYWANNQGRDYRVAVGARPTYPSIDLDGSDVVLSSATTYAGKLGGTITLHNLGYHKSVKVSWSTDGWKTKKTAIASYANSSCGCLDYADFGDLENWMFNASLPAGATQVRLRVTYSDLAHNTTYTDDNFGRDYVLAVPGQLD